MQKNNRDFRGKDLESILQKTRLEDSPDFDPFWSEVRQKIGRKRRNSVRITFYRTAGIFAAGIIVLVLSYRVFFHLPVKPESRQDLQAVITRVEGKVLFRDSENQEMQPHKRDHRPIKTRAPSK